MKKYLLKRKIYNKIRILKLTEENRNRKVENEREKFGRKNYDASLAREIGALVGPKTIKMIISENVLEE